jgi:hypothetical protein
MFGNSFAGRGTLRNKHIAPALVDLEDKELLGRNGRFDFFRVGVAAGIIFAFGHRSLQRSLPDQFVRHGAEHLFEWRQILQHPETAICSR